MPRSLYVYAFVDRRVRSATLSLPGIEVVDAGGLGAVVRRRRAAPRLDEKTLRAQYRVVARVHEKTDAVLPVRFGALVDEEELVRVVRLRRGALAQALRRMRGRSQMTVRLIGPPAPARHGARPVSGADYLRARVDAGRPVLTPYADAILGALRPIASDERLGAGRGPVRLTIDHLVLDGRIARYRSRVERLAEAWDARAETILSGPLPPFAFAPDLWS
jgi:hypothetical protein